MGFWDTLNATFVQATQTDAYSPGNEVLMSRIREQIESIFMLMLDTGDSGSATSNPPNDTTGVLTDTGASYDTDEHNGRTLLITSGSAIGNKYTIDDTTATTIVCTGDNLYSDGVRSGDTYKVLYDAMSNSDGHDHDGINSKNAILAAASIANDRLKSTADTTGASGTLAATTGVQIAMQDYCFSPNVYSVSYDELRLTPYGSDQSDTTARFGLYNTGGTGRAYHVRWRYLTATDNPFLYAVRDRQKGEVLALWACDDPPPGYWGMKEKPDNFVPPIVLSDFDPEIHEEIVIFDAGRNNMMKTLDDRVKSYAGELLPFEVLFKDFDFDGELFRSKNLIMA